MALIIDLTPTTELEAVNTMLASIGEQPLDALGSDDPNETLALNALREVTREVTSQRWRWNTEFGYTVAQTATYSGLSIFAVPNNLADFRLSRTPDQRGIDVVRRASRDYSPGTLVFADRLRAKDGFPVSERTTLKIDPVWFTDFEHCPEVARRYILVRALRSFQRGAVGSAVLHTMSEEDEKTALFNLHLAERQAAPPVVAGAFTTETEAVNTILLQSGQEPIISVDHVLTTEGMAALNELRTAVRDLCTERWSFNSEWGREIAPTGTYTWTNEFDEEYTLNYFVVPDDLISFEVSKVDWQQGHYYLDLARRPSRELEIEATIFADRITNRDGHLRDYLYIDPVWLLAFEDLPEIARRYCLIVASRRYNPERTPYSDRDEFLARKTLRNTYRDKGASSNIFDNASVTRIMGRRPLGPSGFRDWRVTGR